MPIDNSIVHQIHKKPDGQPATLTLREAELARKVLDSCQEQYDCRFPVPGQSCR